MPADTARRLTEAEERAAHLARAVDDLGDALQAQEARIARLERRIALLLAREAEREYETGGTAPVADWTPPHW